MRLRQEMEGMRGALSRCETTLSQVAGAAQVETLGLVVEEQRQRIDAILTGSTAIESITEEFIRQQSDISELQAFLQLPQHKPLRAQLDEAGELMDGETVCVLACCCPYLPYFCFFLNFFGASAESSRGGARNGGWPRWPADRSRRDEQQTAR